MQQGTLGCHTTPFGSYIQLNPAILDVAGALLQDNTSTNPVVDILRLIGHDERPPYGECAVHPLHTHTPRGPLSGNISLQCGIKEKHMGRAGGV
jgi:hypothetical protein